MDAERECSYFLATTEDYGQAENFPPMDPKPGDALTIKTGPNKGSYLIKSVYKFKHYTGSVWAWSYFVKIYGTFPVDVIRSVIEFLDGVGISTATIKIESPASISYPSFFVDGYNFLPAKVHEALIASGATSPGVDAITQVIKSLAEVEYEWGDPARGTLRTFLQEPTLFEISTAKSDSPTLFDLMSSSGQTLTYRPDPNRYESYQVYPSRGTSDTDPTQYPRDYSQQGNLISLDPASGVNPLNSGIEVGDTLVVYPEVPYHGTSHLVSRQTAVMTSAGSSYLSTHPSSGITFTPDRVGDLLFIDEGADRGGYIIQKVISPTTVSVDRTLKRSTPSVVIGGQLVSLAPTVGGGTVVVSGNVLSSYLIGKYITIYGIDSQYQGSFLIVDIPLPNTATVSSTNFSPSVSDSNGRWVITDLQSTPANTTSGTELGGLQPIRIYSNVTIKQAITSIGVNTSTRSIQTGYSRDSFFKEPYYIYRPNIRRVIPQEVQLSRDGPFYYFDTDVVSLGPNDSYNISKDSYMTMRQGSYYSLGYRHVVDDNTLTYSERESGAIVFSRSVLPVTASDSEDSMINLVNAPIQVTYEQASVVADVQTFASSADDKVASADVLVRHFLPSFVSYEATYTGGSSASVIATDIIKLIDSLGIEATLDVSVVQKAIEDRGGNPDTPTKLYVLVHDWDRRQWAEMSENSISMSEVLVPYNGSSRVISFTAGQDTSGLTTLPYGEKINLQKV